MRRDDRLDQQVQFGRRTDAAVDRNHTRSATRRILQHARLHHIPLGHAQPLSAAILG